MSSCRAGRPSRSAAVFLLTMMIGAIGVLMPAEAKADTAEEENRRLFSSIQWQEGPCTVDLGRVAELDIPTSYRFTGPQGARTWARLTNNPPDDDSLGVLLPNDMSWFLSLEYADIGYVPDDEKHDLDADALLATIREGTRQGNAYRRQQGWSELHVVGWQQSPLYDSFSHNLVWAIRGRSDNGEVVNYNTRILGRSGVMSASLVVSPETFGGVVPSIKGILTGFRFKSGQKYAEWRTGDRTAEYGLGALVVGGGTAIAAKTGLLAKLAAFLAKTWKFALLAIAAFFAWLKRSVITGGNSTSD